MYKWSSNSLALFKTCSIETPFDWTRGAHMQSQGAPRRDHQTHFYAEGQAAMVIGETILMALIEHGVLTKQQLLDAIDTAILDEAADGGRRAGRRSLAYCGRAAYRPPNQHRRC